VEIRKGRGRRALLREDAWSRPRSLYTERFETCMVMDGFLPNGSKFHGRQEQKEQPNETGSGRRRFAHGPTPGGCVRVHWPGEMLAKSSGGFGSRGTITEVCIMAARATRDPLRYFSKDNALSESGSLDQPRSRLACFCSAAASCCRRFGGCSGACTGKCGSAAGDGSGIEIPTICVPLRLLMRSYIGSVNERARFVTGLRQLNPVLDG
jgi:hypothetical protein